VGIKWPCLFGFCEDAPAAAKNNDLTSVYNVVAAVTLTHLLTPLACKSNGCFPELHRYFNMTERLYSVHNNILIPIEQSSRYILTNG
jgi:hypothetical protein